MQEAQASKKAGRGNRAWDPCFATPAPRRLRLVERHQIAARYVGDPPLPPSPPPQNLRNRRRAGGGSVILYPLVSIRHAEQCRRTFVFRQRASNTRAKATEELNKARGPNVAVSRSRAHFYVYCTKVGTLWSYTDYWPFVDYEVQPHWLMGWWATGKLANQQYRMYLLKRKRSFRVLLQNFDAVVQAEESQRLERYRLEVAQRLTEMRLPFRPRDDPYFGWGLASFPVTFVSFFF